MGLRHVVVFRWSDSTTREDVAGIEAALGGLPGQIPELRDYRFGPDLGINDDSWDFAVVADFDDLDGYVAYRDHPAHRAVIAEHIGPRLDARAAVQLTDAAG